MPTVRCLVVLPNVSGLPEDHVTNTFHFEVAAYDNTTRVELSTWLADFYNTPPAGQTEEIAFFLSASLSRVADAEMRFYNLADPEPREASVITFTLDAAGTADRLPDEVAICTSFYSVRNLPRQRGRIFIGPFNSQAIDLATGRPKSVLRDVIGGATERLANESDVTNQWVILSTASVPDTTFTVTDGWIDNAWDTQRRRGLAATSRDEWSAV